MVKRGGSLTVCLIHDFKTSVAFNTQIWCGKNWGEKGYVENVEYTEMSVIRKC